MENITEGKKYLTRGGKLVGPIKAGRSERWPWIAHEFSLDGQGEFVHWDSVGRFKTDGSVHPMDLLEEVAERPFVFKDAGEVDRPESMTKAGLLKLATEAVADRGLNYGKPEDNFARIANHWNTFIRNRFGAPSHYDVKTNLEYIPSFKFSPGDVAQMMILMKIARLENQPNHQDSIVDIAGYAACMAEIELNPTRT